MSWRHIVIEGFCLGFDPEKEPCGRSVGVHCLRDGHCPYFAYADSNEREAAFFVPLHQILVDRIKSLSGDIWNKLTWYLWNKWFYDPDWIKTIGSVRCPEIDEGEEEKKSKFSEWIRRNR